MSTARPGNENENYTGLHSNDAALTTREFLRSVLPDEGPYYLMIQNPGKETKFHWSYPTIEAMAAGAQEYAAKGCSVWHGCAGYKAAFVERPDMRSPGKHRKHYRVAENVRGMRAFWIDVDCGAAKAASGDGYATHAEATKAVLKFCADVGLVEPLILDSGNGVHVYFPLAEMATPEEWKSGAEALKAALAVAGVRQDLTRTADGSSVLRPVGTHNRKDPSNPKLVQVIQRGGGVMTLEAFKAALGHCGGASASVSRSTGAREQVSEGVLGDVPAYVREAAGMAGNALAKHDGSRRGEPASFKRIESECALMAHVTAKAGDVGRDAWFGALTVLHESEEGVEYAVERWDGHPGFSEDETRSKFDSINGKPQTCRKLATSSEGRAICSGCKHHGSKGFENGLSPIVFGREPLAAGVIADATQTVDSAPSARDEAGVDWLTATNQNWFVVRQGGKTLAWTEEFDSTMGRHRLTPTGERDFKSWFANVKVPMGDRHMKLGDAWWTHPLRRQYQGITFAPGAHAAGGYYNTWRGFGVEPVAGGCGLILRHVHEVICDGDAEHAGYVLNWAARMVQRPDLQGEVAIVVQGEKGAGKSQFGRLLMSLMGRHAMQIASSEHLCGKFTGHLRDTVFLFCDEAFYAGDKRAEAVLKMVITEPVLMVESKYADAQQVRNYLHIYMATNNAWAVPMSADERRFMVLEASNRYRGDAMYFNALNREIDHGGREAFLRFLLDRDISTFNVRAVPRTDAGARQKLLSNGPVHQWLEERLHAGAVLRGDQGWIEARPSQQVTDEIAEFYEKHGGGRRGDAPTAQEVRGLLDGVLPMARVQKRQADRRVWHWEFPPLGEARRLFSEHFDSPGLFAEDETSERVALNLVGHG
jgi:Family of unknown function (DUF5906)